MPKHGAKRANKAPQKDNSRVHTYYGEEVARPLVAWLNKGGDQLHGIAGLLEIAGRHRQAEARGTRPARLLMRLLQAKANGILADYRFAPVIDSMNDRWEIQWVGIGGQGGEAQFVLLLLELAERGLIHSLRRCAKEDCKRWFFAHYDHQRFDSDQCRIAVLQGDPARQEARKAYMRELRRLKKLRSKGGRK
jgi:hypothetical protein